VCVLVRERAASMSTSSKEVEAEAVRLVLQLPDSRNRSELAVLEFCCANPWITKHSLNFGPTKKDRNYILQKILEKGVCSFEHVTEFCETFYPNGAAFPEMEEGGGVMFAPLHFACSQKNAAGEIIPHLATKFQTRHPNGTFNCPCTVLWTIKICHWKTTKLHATATPRLLLPNQQVIVVVCS